MKVEILNPETKETLTTECDDGSLEYLTEKYKPITSNDELIWFIEN